MKKVNKYEKNDVAHPAFQVRSISNQPNFRADKRLPVRGWTAVWQSRLVLLVMINIAQLWILSAAVEAALAREFKQLLPLVIASGVCWLIALTIFLWWKPASRRVINSKSNADQKT
ncbi:MAG TPA: hypothetical protein PKY82_33770 [Pyrinomonadaceae bacterium]|nr:hypothetical protein [Pyrinomonadaceae bacterium]